VLKILFGYQCIHLNIYLQTLKKDLNLSTEMMILVTDKVDKKTEKEFFSICKINT